MKRIIFVMAKGCGNHAGSRHRIKMDVEVNQDGHVLSNWEYYGVHEYLDEVGKRRVGRYPFIFQDGDIDYGGDSENYYEEYAGLNLNDRVVKAGEYYTLILKSFNGKVKEEVPLVVHSVH